MTLVGQDEISAAVRQTHETVFVRELATFKDEALADLKAVIPFDSAIWGSGAESPQLIFGIATHAFSPERLLDYALRWQPHDRLRAGISAQSGVCLRNEDLGPIADYRASAIYQGFCRSAGIEHALGITIVDPITNVGELIFLFRCQAGAFYSDDERDAMAQIMPHLVLSWRHRLLLHVRERARGSGDGIAPSPHGYAVIDDLGQVHASDPAFGLKMREHFADWIGPALPAALMPILANGATLCDAAGQRFAILRGDGRHIVSLVVEAERLPISPAEHRVALLYAEGRTAAAVARTLGLSPLTVRNHLTSVYAKLSVNSKIGLARRLSAQD